MRARLKWLLFALSALVLLGALGWVSSEALDLERRTNESRVYSARQSVLRLALWRMDAALAPLIAAESARPAYQFAPFYREGQAYLRLGSPAEQQGVYLPSPLVSPAPEDRESFQKLYFQVGPDGEWSSPQAPAQGQLRQAAVQAGFTSEEDVRAAGGLLLELSGRVGYAELLSACGQAAPAAALPSAIEPAPVVPSAGEAATAGADELAVRERNLARARRQLFSATQQRKGRISDTAPAAFLPWMPVGQQGQPVELFLLRSVSSEGGVFVQGVWVDWEGLRAWLLAQVEDLIVGTLFDRAHVDLEPAPAGQSPGRARREIGQISDRLAALPCSLRVSGLQPIAYPVLSAPRAALAVAWSAVLAAIACVGLVLRAAYELSERRGQFVSAVTHELRTPLTTFCMYSEMLADGMVRDPARRQEYLETLKSESARLRRIVESVLAYARVEDNRGAESRARIEAAALLARALPPLERRVAQAGFALHVTRGGLEGAWLELDAQAVEQILFNLVDNACKYAARAADKTVSLAAKVEAGKLWLELSDGGPGIPSGKEKEVFEPFHRAVGDEGGRIPGLGLGLALSRGLARQMGGDLLLLPGPGGRFRLVLPLSALSAPAKTATLVTVPAPRRPS